MLSFALLWLTGTGVRRIVLYVLQDESWSRMYSGDDDDDDDDDDGDGGCNATRRLPKH